MRLVVTGGRSFNDKDFVNDSLFMMHQYFPISLLIEGGATGADALAKQWAESLGIEIKTYEADWKNLNVPYPVIKTNRYGSLYNAKAGFDRNELMITDGLPDFGIAFSGDKGTKNMKSLLKKHHVDFWDTSSEDFFSFLKRTGPDIITVAE